MMMMHVLLGCGCIWDLVMRATHLLPAHEAGAHSFRQSSQHDCCVKIEVLNACYATAEALVCNGKGEAKLVVLVAVVVVVGRADNGDTSAPRH